ncbi:MAG: T9SS type A sorting domain-containing protein [Saprospiraceae bacterium]|nr:T9SS type A sorting domain-containing protein [Saprospiraceae bacterium]
MNVCTRNTFISLWLLFGAVALSAQGACFYFPTINNAAPGSNKLMPLKVVNLDSIVAMQLVIRWDPQVLKFLTIDMFGLQGLNLGNFNTSRAIDSGYVRLQWEGPTSIPPGTSVADSSTIFRMRFNVIGPVLSSSPVIVTEILDFPPLNFELVKVKPDTSNVVYTMKDSCITNGFIAVGYTVATNEPGDNEVALSISPNPFSVSAQFQFELTETADVQVFITDALGHIVFENNFFQLPTGQHGMVIEKDKLGAPGLYSLTLQAGQKIATRRVVLF